MTPFCNLFIVRPSYMSWTKRPINWHL